ncbi:MAG: hypothetical protein OIF32_03995, partial [Campylobacterales bacterium]|nr:hypothetical protein [Campylobacterales bacterium]
GEELEIEAIFTATSKVNLSGLSFDPENIEGFTVKNLQSQWLGQRLGEKNRFKRKFTVVPQKSGNMKIDGQPLVAQFQNGRSMFATTSSKRFYSNKLQINVKPLPKGVSVVGDFEIESKIDKQEVKEGEAVTVTYTIFGFGSLDGLDFGEPSVEGVTVYKDKETIKNSFQNERLYSVFKVKIAYLSGDDFAIPKKSIKFFDPKKKKIVSKFTKPYQIKVKKISKKIKRDKPEIVQKKEKNQEIKEKDEKNIELEKYYFLIYGLIVGIIIGFFINFKREKKSRDNNFTLNFSKFKFSNKKELYNKLLPHVDNPEVKEMVQRLENHLYRGDNSDIKGSEIKKLLKKIMGK